MNDIVLRSDLQSDFPGIVESVRKARLLQQVRSWADLERLFFRGEGKAAATYKAYMLGVKGLFEYTNGLPPHQILPADIEGYFDSLAGMASKTRALRMTGLRQFFKRVSAEVGISNPWDEMSEGLRKKLARAGKSQKKKALTKTAMAGLLKMLRSDESAEGLRRYSIVVSLYTTGLRASEFCSLRWRDVEDVDGTWVATFIQKGGDQAEQKIPQKTMSLLRKAFRAREGRAPRPEDPLASNAVGGALTRGTLWKVLVEGVLPDAKAAGLIRDDIEFSAHLFRRSAGTHLARQKHNVVAIQQFMRHRDFSTTARSYIDVDTEGAAELLEAIV